MTADERRGIVELLVKTIVVGKGNVEFNLRYRPRIEQLTERNARCGVFSFIATERYRGLANSGADNFARANRKKM